MAEMVIDKAGLVSVDRVEDVLIVDGVRCAMELVVAATRMNGDRWFRPWREGDALIVNAIETEHMKTAHSLAYERAEEIVRSELVVVAHKTFDSRSMREGTDDAEGLAAAMAYLVSRGLLERHETEPSWVSVRDESEAAG